LFLPTLTTECLKERGQFFQSFGQVSRGWRLHLQTRLPETWKTQACAKRLSSASSCERTLVTSTSVVFAAIGTVMVIELPPERTRSDANVCATAFAVGHLPDVVDGAGRGVRKDFHLERLAIFADTIATIVDVFDRVCKDRSPPGNVFDFSQKVKELGRFGICFDSMGNGLRSHGVLDENQGGRAHVCRRLRSPLMSMSLRHLGRTDEARHRFRLIGFCIKPNPWCACHIATFWLVMVVVAKETTHDPQT
jgi:hypothetical protein